MRIRRGHTAPPASASSPDTVSSSTTAAVVTSAAATASAAHPDVFHASRDMRTRIGVSAIQAGSTTTVVPRLLEGWRQSLLEAAAEDLADAEVLAPVRDQALADAAAHKGAPLSRQEARSVSRAVRKQHEAAYDDAKQHHHRDLSRSPAVMKQTERDVVLAHRPRIQQLRDVFTPVATRQPGARDLEIVLWESPRAMVLVDTFAPSPKALVVPKQPASLPTDLQPTELDELAALSAHVSDAFMRATGSQPAGIWVNPPQHLTVRQLHVHVLPDLGPYTADDAPARAFLEDPHFRPQLEAFFDGVKQELVARLGPPT
jgi:diadenosine tetraphosphate (Ap4A) HIT family hydrolase